VIPSYDLPEENVSVHDVRNHFFTFVPLAVRTLPSSFSFFIFLLLFLFTLVLMFSAVRLFDQFLGHL